MSNYNYVNRVLVGDGTNDVGTVSLPTIKKGDLLFLDKAGNVISTNAGSAALAKFEEVSIALGVADGKARVSSPIQGNMVSAYEGVAFRAPAEKVIYVGYNGTANTGLDVSASTEYKLRVDILDDHRFNGQRQTLSDYNYDGGAGATASDAIDTIACLYEQRDYGHNYLNDKVLLERVSNGTPNAFGVGADATVTKGSKSVSTAVAQTVAVGNYIRIGAATFDAPIYKVTKVIDNQNFEIDVEYLGASGVIAAANISVMADQTEYGFKLTGVAQDSLLSRNENEPWAQYEWINFNAGFAEADDRSFDSAATVTVATELDPGNGYWKQVAEAEEAAKGYLGDTSKRRFHDNRINSNVVNGTTYDTIVITHYASQQGDFQGQYTSPLKTEIYVPDGSDQGSETDDNFVHILNGFFSTVVGFPAISF